MKRLLVISLIALVAPSLYAQVDTSVVDQSTSQEANQSDASHTATLNYPDSSPGSLISRLSSQSPLYPVNHINDFTTYQFGLRYPAIGLKYLPQSQYQVGISDNVNLSQPMNAPLRQHSYSYLYSNTAPYINDFTTLQVGLQYPVIGADHPFTSNYQVSGSDPLGVLVEMAVNGVMYATKKSRLQKHQ